MTRGRIALVAALTLVAASAAADPPAPAQPPQAPAYPVDLVTALPSPSGKGGAAAAVLVGRSGQLYLPAPRAAGADPSWQRQTAGGISADLVSAVRSRLTPGDVLAAGHWAPPFRHSGATWRAQPLDNSGSAVLAGTGLPALAVGRHIYILTQDRWRRRASTGRTVTALWASGKSWILVATADGALTRWDGRRFRPIATALADGDAIELLIGEAPAHVYGRAKSGAWLRIDRGARAVAMTASPALVGFDEHAAGLGPGGALLLAGTVTAAAGSPTPVLVRSQGTQLQVWDHPGPLAAGDRFAVVWTDPKSGEVLVASRTGAVHLRGKTGTWSSGTVSGALPASSRPAMSPGATPAPAH